MCGGGEGVGEGGSCGAVASSSWRQYRGGTPILTANYLAGGVAMLLRTERDS